MRINIKSANLELTPALREYIEKKIGTLSRILARFEKMAEIEVDVEVSRSTKHHQKGYIFYAEANVRFLDKMIRGERYAPDIRVAINDVKDILHRELSKYKEKKMVNREKIKKAKGKWQ